MFSEGRACVNLGTKRAERGVVISLGKWGFIDRAGKMIIEPRFELQSAFSEGLADVQIEGDEGYIDKTGKMVISPQFTYAGDFSEGLAPACVGYWKTGKWGFIDRPGKFVIKPRFDRVEPFSDGLALVEIDEKRGYVDRTGRYIWKPTK